MDVGLTHVALPVTDPEASLERYESEGCEFIGLALPIEERPE